MDEIESRFQKFKDLSAEFSRETARVLYSQTRVNPSTAAQVNIELAKTVFSKWSIEILSVLYSVRTSSYGELKRELRGITSKILSEKLKKLEQGSLIRREVISGRPPRTTYSLTDKGLTVAKLGEPVFLYMAYTEGLYAPQKFVIEERTPW